MAGVFLQQLIVEATPRRTDQDHLQVVCFTNPHVPERMRSLAQDGGRRYAEAVRASARLLVVAGATHIVDSVQYGARQACGDSTRGGRPDREHGGTGASRRWSPSTGTASGSGCSRPWGPSNSGSTRTALPGAALEWLLPDVADQRRVSEAILAVKVNESDPRGRVTCWRDRGAGSREERASSWSDARSCRCAWTRCGRPGVPLVDPMRILARHLVEIGLRLRQEGAASAAGPDGRREPTEAEDVHGSDDLRQRPHHRRTDAVIPVLDHGFLYGEGVYEVMRTYERRPFLYGRAHRPDAGGRPA